MGFRFRRSIKLLPGVRLNVSKSGFSTTLGPRGATLSLGKRGPRANLGLPGTGLSYSTALNAGARPPAQGFVSGPPASGSGLGCGLLVIVGFIILAVATCSGNPASGPEEASARTLFVAADRLNCRMVPAAGGTIVTRLDAATSVKVAEDAGEWSKVEAAGAECWVASRFLSAGPPATPPAQAFVPASEARSSAAHKTTSRSSTHSSSRSSSSFRTKSSRRSRSSGDYSGSTCPCSGSHVCIGPRGGRYCITSGGNKRYGV